MDNQEQLRFWLERDELELSAIAALATGKLPGLFDISAVSAHLGVHRALKDAIRAGDLQPATMNGDGANKLTTVRRSDYRTYVSGLAKGSLADRLSAVADAWDAHHGVRFKSKAALNVLLSATAAMPDSVKAKPRKKEPSRNADLSHLATSPTS